MQTTEDLIYLYEIEKKLIEVILSNPLRHKQQITIQKKFNECTRQLKLYRYIEFKDFDYLVYLKNLLKFYKIEYTNTIKIKLYRLILNSNVLKTTSYGYALFNIKTKTVKPKHKFYTCI